MWNQVGTLPPNMEKIYFQHYTSIAFAFVYARSKAKYSTVMCNRFLNCKFALLFRSCTVVILICYTRMKA